MNRIGRLTRPAPMRAWAVWLGLGLLLTVVRPVGAEESWDAVYMGRSKIGSIHTDVTPLDYKGRKLVRVQVTWMLKLKRLNDQVTMKMRYGTIETPEGSVLRLDTRTEAGQGVMRTYGDVIDGKMTLISEAGGRQTQAEVPWGPDVRGPYAAELSLSRQPLKPGEVREVQTFIPELNQICNTRLTAKEAEPVTLGGSQKRSLLRVESELFDAQGKPRSEMNSTLWVDEGGQILKSYTGVFGGITTYRTTRAAAETDAPAGGEADVIENLIVKVPQKIPDPDKTRDILYRVSVQGTDPAEVFASDSRQTLRKDRSGTALLEVQTRGPTDGPTGPESVAEEYLRANPQIDSEDSRVVALMRKAIGRQTDPWQKAVAIGKWVAQNLKDKNFNTAFAPASEVARDLTGDCTEHSVLTAAMCRAAGIPARVAIGLVYVDRLGGFGYHMWTEVYVNRRWVAIDSTFDQSEVDAVHIKLADTSLDGISPFDSFLTVAKVADKMTLQPIEIR